jgi:hypothetical protein
MPNDVAGGPVRRLTYTELAAERGVTRGAAERLVRRRRWPKVLGNDGRVRVLVPPPDTGPAVEHTSRPRRRARTPPPDTGPDIAPAIAAAVAPLMTLIEIERRRADAAIVELAVLRAELEARRRRDAERQAGSVPAVPDRVRVRWWRRLFSG